MSKKDFKMPSSDFNRYEDRQKDMDESHKIGEGIYLKGDKRNGQTKEKQK